MVLKLTTDHLKTIQTQAESTYPEECCGLLLGKLEHPGQDKILTQIWPTLNTWDATVAAEMQTASTFIEPGLGKTRHYWIDPKAMLQAQRYGRDRHLDIIGIYHSHPDHPASPSEFDRVYAWSQYSYIIVSVQNGIAVDIKNWSLDDDHHFQPEEMVTVASIAL